MSTFQRDFCLFELHDNYYDSFLFFSTKQEFCSYFKTLTITQNAITNEFRCEEGNCITKTNCCLEKCVSDFESEYLATCSNTGTINDLDNYCEILCAEGVAENKYSNCYDVNNDQIDCQSCNEFNCVNNLMEIFQSKNVPLKDTLCMRDNYYENYDDFCNDDYDPSDDLKSLVKFCWDFDNKIKGFYDCSSSADCCIVNCYENNIQTYQPGCASVGYTYIDNVEDYCVQICQDDSFVLLEENGSLVSEEDCCVKKCNLDNNSRYLGCNNVENSSERFTLYSNTVLCEL